MREEDESGPPQAVHAASSRVVEHLSTATCWELIQQSELGRVALIDADGMPNLYPVNYVAHEGALYVRTARDSKLFHIASRPAAGFEVDGEDDNTYWSVVIKGAAEQLLDPTEVRASGILGVDSRSPTSKQYVIKITPKTVTGRRFQKRSEAEDPPASTQPTDRKKRADRRDDRPQHIAHFPPLGTNDS
jgi:nitroimidazol reductase NimA-like FMN-containing flavoprotein (pyridoxamine 5'-phosphate oxidase superfamily)